MRLSLPFLSAVAVFVLGCGSSTKPDSEPSVVLTLHVSEGSGNTLTALAIAENTSRIPVYFYGGCGCDGIYLNVHDNVDEIVPLYCGPLPSCPCREEGLEPEEAIRETLRFEGKACSFEAPDDFQPVPPGTYSIIARFRYFWTDKDGATQYREVDRNFRFDL